MKTGRPSKHPRSDFGQRLHAAREAAGLSQAHVADKLGVHQTSYAAWERHPVALRPEQLKTLADLCGVTVEHLVGTEETPKRGTGPAGKLRQVFERASKLPRDQQKHVVRAVEDAIAGCEARRGREV
ncbi:MAG: helix-turn-helix domain-containing protein, partial [Opitutaceae bacterium]